MFKKTKKIWRISNYQNYARAHILRKFGFDVGKLKTEEFYEISEMIYDVFELSGSFEMYDFLGKGVIEERFTEMLIQELQERNHLSKSSSNQPLGNTKKFGEEQLKPRAKTPPTKTVNYTPEMVSQMAEMAPLNLEKAQALSNTLGRSVRSIIAKAKREGIVFESVEPVANRVKGQTKAASPEETQLVKPKNSVTKKQVSKSINDKTISVAAVNQEKEKTQSNSKPYVGKFFLASSVVAVLVLYGILSINENLAPVYRASIQSLELSNAATPLGYFSVEDHDIGTINESFEWQYQEESLFFTIYNPVPEKIYIVDFSFGDCSRISEPQRILRLYLDTELGPSERYTYEAPFPFLSFFADDYGCLAATEAYKGRVTQ